MDDVVLPPGDDPLVGPGDHHHHYICILFWLGMGGKVVQLEHVKCREYKLI